MSGEAWSPRRAAARNAPPGWEKGGDHAICGTVPRGVPGPGLDLVSDLLRLVRADPHPVALLGGPGPVAVTSWPPTRSGVAVRPGPAADVLDAPLPDLAHDQAGAAFGGGWIGYLELAVAGQVLPVPPAPGAPRQLPAWWFGYYDHVLRRDRATGRWWFEALPDLAAVPRWSAGSGSCRSGPGPAAASRGVIPAAASG